ncbi:hypothetical protein Tcan_12980, partial [Toxocara canis]
VKSGATSSYNGCQQTSGFTVATRFISFTASFGSSILSGGRRKRKSSFFPLRFISAYNDNSTDNLNTVAAKAARDALSSSTTIQYPQNLQVATETLPRCSDRSPTGRAEPHLRVVIRLWNTSGNPSGTASSYFLYHA